MVLPWSMCATIEKFLIRDVGILARSNELRFGRQLCRSTSASSPYSSSRCALPAYLIHDVLWPVSIGGIAIVGAAEVSHGRWAHTPQSQPRGGRSNRGRR